MTQTVAQLSESELRVVHAVPGRVRVRTTDSSLIPTLNKVAQQLRQQDGVCEVRTNPTTHSLVVTFNQSILSLPQTLEILQKTGISELSEKTQPLPELKSDSFLREQTEPPWKIENISRSLIPLAAGMVVTGALGLEGAVAFPVFVIVQNVAREVIKQVQSEKPASKPIQTAQTTAIERNGKSPRVAKKSRSEIEPSEIDVQIVHEIPGRIRFRVPRIAEDAEYTRKLTTLLEADVKVTDVRVNSIAASIAISYSMGGISDAEMRLHLIELIQTADKINIPLNVKAHAPRARTSSRI
jgi:hypothetical protein